MISLKLKNKEKILDICLYFLLIGLAVIFFLQSISPLRLNTDSIVLLGIAASVADGNGFLFNGATTRYPIGYPAMVAALDMVGFASSVTLIIFNMLFFSLGICFSFMTYRAHFLMSKHEALFLSFISALSYVYVKHVTMPITEAVFFGLFMSSMWVLSLAEKADSLKAKLKFLLAGSLLICVSIMVRSAGVVLIPALIWVLCGKNISSHLQSKALLKGLALWSVILISCAFSFFYFLSDMTYLTEMQFIYAREGVIAGFGKYVGLHFVELGEVFINAPSAKLSFLPKWLFFIFGITFFSTVCFGIWACRKNFSIVEVLLLSYIAMIFIWPYTDARFWLPVISVMFGYTFFVYKRFSRVVLIRLSATGMVVIYSTFGFVALFYTSFISFSGDKFVDFYGDGSHRAAYRAAFSGGSGESNDVVLKLLQRFDSKSRQNQTIKEL